jgi:hypothetical protein
MVRAQSSIPMKTTGDGEWLPFSVFRPSEKLFSKEMEFSGIIVDAARFSKKIDRSRLPKAENDRGRPSVILLNPHEP